MAIRDWAGLFEDSQEGVKRARWLPKQLHRNFNPPALSHECKGVQAELLMEAFGRKKSKPQGVAGHVIFCDSLARARLDRCFALSRKRGAPADRS